MRAGWFLEGKLYLLILKRGLLNTLNRSIERGHKSLAKLANIGKRCS